MSVFIPWWLIVVPALVVAAGLTMALVLILIRVWFLVLDRVLHLARAHRLFIFFIHNREEISKIFEERKAAAKWDSSEEESK